MTTQSSVSPSRHIFSHELRKAILAALAAVPEVSLVSYLQYWGQQHFFIRLLPHTDGGRQRAEAALQELLQRIQPELPSKVHWRFLSPEENLPSSAVLYERR